MYKKIFLPLLLLALASCSVQDDSDFFEQNSIRINDSASNISGPSNNTNHNNSNNSLSIPRNNNANIPPDSPSKAPSVNLLANLSYAITSHGLNLTWTSNDATHYILKAQYEHMDHFNETYLTIADDLSTNSYQHLLKTFTGNLPLRYIISSCNENTCIDSNSIEVNTSHLNEHRQFIKSETILNNDNFGYTVSLAPDGETFVATKRFQPNFLEIFEKNDHDNDPGTPEIFQKTQSITDIPFYIIQEDTPDDFKFLDWSITQTFSIESIQFLENGQVIALGIPDGFSGLDYSGVVVLYKKNENNQWIYSETLIPPASSHNENFGKSLSSNDIYHFLIVGDSHGHDVGETEDLNHGQAYVYEKMDHDNNSSTPERFIFKQTLSAHNKNQYDAFGSSLDISLDGETIVIGAHGEDASHQDIYAINDFPTDNASAINSGAAYVFKYIDHDNNNTTPKIFVQSHYLKPSNTHANMFFGYKISINNTSKMFAVSSPYESSSHFGITQTYNDNSTEPANIGSGAIFVFNENTDNSINQYGIIKLQNYETYQYLGYNGLKFFNSVLYTSSVNEYIDSIGNGNPTKAGSLMVYHIDQNNIFERTQIIQGYTGEAGSTQRDHFGISFDVTTNTMVVGSELEDSNNQSDEDNDNASNSGAVYAY